MSLPKKLRIGDLLVQNKIISESQLESALAEQRKTGRKLGRTLLDLGYITEDELLEFLSRQLRIPLVDLRHHKLNAELARRLPETHARRFRCILLEDRGTDVVVGMSDPTDIFAYDEVARLLKRPVSPAAVREHDLLGAIDTVYRRKAEINHLAEELEEELHASTIEYLQPNAEEEATSAPVVRLLQSVFEDAAQVRASDVHIEPDEAVLRIRHRVDGVLHEQIMKEQRIARALVMRLKIMAGLNIAEKRLPQDGRFQIKTKGRTIDVRLSTMPVQFGESVVMRLLDQSGGILELDSLGMPGEVLRRYRRQTRQPHGMILVTGPTGSGKTTTLYATLTELNRAEKKIITVEDPVEYRLPRINQVQLQPGIGLTYAKVLRTALRQDPDIVMVGEMRDQESVELGLRAALTGHLVLSTLHTNDAISATTRLLDMGAPGYLMAAALRAVVAQRLVRRICADCSEPYRPTPQERVWLRALAGDGGEAMDLRRGEGCNSCNGTGYRGRIGIYELLELGGELADALRSGDAAQFTRLAERQPGYRSLGRSALDYAGRGLTTVEAAMEVAGHVPEEPHLEVVAEGQG